MTDPAETWEKLLPAITAGLSEALVDMITTARGLRDDVSISGADDSLEEIHGQLVINRAKIERLEYLTSTLALLKSRTAGALADARAAYDDAYMHSATAKSVGFSDYASAKEKDAHYNLKTISETMSLRKAESTHRDVEAAWDYCRTLLRGSQDVQRDNETRIRIISLRSHLERQMYADGTPGHSGTDTSKARAEYLAASTMMDSLKAKVHHLIQWNGTWGMTVKEAKQVIPAEDHHHGTVSSVFTNLHMEGWVVRLEESRSGNKVYVLPEYVADRPTEAFKPNTSKAASQVKALVAYLDHTDPNWREKIGPTLQKIKA